MQHLSFSDDEHALMSSDSVMHDMMILNGPLIYIPRGDYFESLTRSIVGQQISVKAAASIYARFKVATKLDPVIVASMSDEELRSAGISANKARYIRDVAEHFVEDSAVFNHLDSLHDDDVIMELTRIKGIGVWTAQMFLMFTLMRPDVFAPDDAGLQNAVMKWYVFDAKPTRSELETFAERWAPYRTTASWHLWHSLNNSPE